LTMDTEATETTERTSCEEYGHRYHEGVCMDCWEHCWDHHEDHACGCDNCGS